MQELTDTELVSIYLGGKDSALDELIARYFRQIFLFSKTYVKSDQEAEDITQEVFVKLWKNIKKYDSQKKFKTWLFQITKNTCIDFLRKHKHVVAAENVDEETMSIDLERMTDKNPLPDEMFDSQAFANELDELLSRLPAPQKAVVTLHLQNGLTFEEIAEILGEPLNTVKSRYRRTLLSIRQELGKPSG